MIADQANHVRKMLKFLGPENVTLPTRHDTSGKSMIKEEYFKTVPKYCNSSVTVYANGRMTYNTDSKDHDDRHSAPYDEHEEIIGLSDFDLDVLERYLRTIVYYASLQKAQDVRKREERDLAQALITDAGINIDLG